MSRVDNQIFQMHRHGPLLGELAKAQYLVEQFLFPEAVVDLLDSDFVPDGPVRIRSNRRMSEVSSSRPATDVRICRAAAY